MEARERLLREKEEALALGLQKVERQAASTQHMVKLCVGGTTFLTTRDTLLAVEDSFFAVLLGSGKWLPTHDGGYFIDRDPTHFPVILNFLRTGTVAQDALKSGQLEVILKLQFVSRSWCFLSLVALVLFWLVPGDGNPQVIRNFSICFAAAN